MSNNEIRQRAERFITKIAKEGLGWQSATLAPTATPLFRPDLDEIAYYEIAVVQGTKPAGYVLLSTGPHDAPITQWSDTAEGPAAELTARATRAGARIARIYMLDVLAFVAEDSSGNLVATVGDIPTMSLRGQTPGGAKSPDLKLTRDWAALKAQYRTTFAAGLDALRKGAVLPWRAEQDAGQANGASNRDTRSISFSCGEWETQWAGANEQRWYGQIPANTYPNTSNCPSGCGATAWAMLFGWADFKAAQGAAPWAASGGIYPGGTPDATAPKTMDGGVRDMTWEIRKAIETECVDGDTQGRTWPWNMEQANEYLKDRTTASVTVEFHKATNFDPRNDLRDKAKQLIKEGRPVILGLGWEHYVLAYGHREKDCIGSNQHEFKINEGWELGHGRWTSADVWFVGSLNPANPNSKITAINDAYVMLFDDDHFKDRRARITYTPATSGLDNFDQLSSQNGDLGFGDKTSSARWEIPEGWAFVLFDDAGYRDRRFVLSGNGKVREDELSGFGDKASSGRWERITITDAADGYVELFEDKNFKGKRKRFAFGDNDKRLSNNDFNDKASSVRWHLPTGAKVTLYEHAEYRGAKHVLTGTGEFREQDELKGFNDKASSLKWSGP